MRIEKFSESQQMLPGQISSEGIGKQERYQWDNPGEPGQFKMIDKKNLLIDLEYQRTMTSENRALRIAGEFQWSLFGCLMVVQRGNDLYVIDGGNRLRAVWKRSDITYIPCMVYTSKSIKDEAELFFKLSTTPIGMSAYQRFRAQLVAEYEPAVLADSIVKKYGYTIEDRGSDPYTCGCVHKLQGIIKRNKNYAELTINILSKICQGYPIRKSPVDGLFYLIINNKEIDFLNDYPFEKLKNAGIENIENEIIRISRALQKGGEKISAMALLNIINSGQGKRKNKVIIP